MNQGLKIECGPRERNGSRVVFVSLDDIVHRDKCDTDRDSERRRLRESICVKFGLNDDAHEWLESQIIQAADNEDDSCLSLWEPIATCLSEVSSSEPNYLWQGRIAFGMLHDFTGDGGVGKGLSLMDISARGSRGDAMPPLNAPDNTFEPWSTLFITSEDSPEYVLRPRAEAAGACLDRIITMSSVQIPDSEKRAVALLQDIDLIEKLIVENNVKLLNIDPWSEFLDPQFNINSDPDNRKVLGPLADMAQRTGVAVVYVRHMNKKEGQSAQYRGVGSTAPLNAARAAYVVAPDPDDSDRRILACTKFNIGIKPASLSFRIESCGTAAKIYWEGECNLSASDITRATHKPSGGKMDRAKEIIQEILEPGPRGSNEVLQACLDEGISERTYKTARKELGVLADKTEFNGQWLLTLPSVNGGVF